VSETIMRLFGPSYGGCMLYGISSQLAERREWPLDPGNSRD
jgi:hypothetical protein